MNHNSEKIAQPFSVCACVEIKAKLIKSPQNYLEWTKRDKLWKYIWCMNCTVLIGNIYLYLSETWKNLKINHKFMARGYDGNFFKWHCKS